MLKFNKDSFNNFLLKHKIVGIKADGITLKSGRTSYWYANCRTLTDYTGPAGTLVRYLLDFTEELNLNFDYYYGIPEGITKLAVLANYIRSLNNNNPGHPLVIGRSKPKQHGDPRDKFFIGPVQSGQSIIVIEDVTTTGGSLLQSLESLEQAGLKIQAVITLFDRMQKRDDGKTVKDAVNKKGYDFFALADAFNFLPFFIKKTKPPQELIDKINQELKQSTVRPIKLD
ncbi:MAG: phosphoribosyltransferase family protein [bacterium]